MLDLFAETKFYFVKTDDNKYSLFSIATDKLILADVEKSDIDEFLQNNNPTHPSQPGAHSAPGGSILFPLTHDSGSNFYDLTSSSGLLAYEGDYTAWSDFFNYGSIWLDYEDDMLEK